MTKAPTKVIFPFYPGFWVEMTWEQYLNWKKGNREVEQLGCERCCVENVDLWSMSPRDLQFKASNTGVQLENGREVDFND